MAATGAGSSLARNDGRDSPRMAKGGEDKASPNASESKIAAANGGGAPNNTMPESLTVRVELVVVDGAAGKELLRKQAIVVRQALQWFADHRLDNHGHKPNAEPQ
jgi:hypothetical protein